MIRRRHRTKSACTGAALLCAALALWTGTNALAQNGEALSQANDDAATAISESETASGDTGDEETGAPEHKDIGDRLLDAIVFDALRYRHMFQEDFDLNRQVDDGDNFDWFKFGMGIDIQAHDYVRLRTIGRLTRSWGANRLANRQQDHFDLWEGLIELGSKKKLGLSLTAGRQKINFGNQRLIGALEWLNNARVFQGVRLSAKIEGNTDLDAFWVREVRFEDPDDRNHNRARPTDIAGVYAVIPFKALDLRLEPFHILKYDDNRRPTGEDGMRAPLVVNTTGLRTYWQLGLDFVFDMYAMAQYGKFGTDTMVAYAFSNRLDFNAPDGIWPLHRVRIEFNYGSGDKDPNDRRHNTVDNLYPTNNAFYGEMGLASWQNTISLQFELAFELYETPKGPEDPGLTDLAFALLAPPETKALLGASLWSFWLARDRDAWYSAGGNVLGVDPTGSSGRYVGEELDVWFKFGFWKVAYSHFWPGHFARRTRGDNGADQFYIEFGDSF